MICAVSNGETNFGRTSKSAIKITFVKEGRYIYHRRVFVMSLQKECGSCNTHEDALALCKRKYFTNAVDRPVMQIPGRTDLECYKLR